MAAAAASLAGPAGTLPAADHQEHVDPALSPHPPVCGCVVDAAHYTPVPVVAGEECAEYETPVGRSVSGPGAGPVRSGSTAGGHHKIGPAEPLAAAAVGLFGQAKKKKTLQQVKNIT